MMAVASQYVQGEGISEPVQEAKTMSMTKSEVCVIIAAKNAGGTIAVAIASALREPEVAEVVVVDDGSTDDTAEIARSADDGSGRLKVMRLDVNRGPSFARNAAIAGSKAPFISILDADDFFLEGRFRNLFASADWDFAADPEFLDFERFVEGNISRRRVQRGELGFLKPVISRTFLDRHRLRYDESLRLGEDYELYARAVAHGARFRSSAPAAMAPSCAPIRSAAATRRRI